MFNLILREMNMMEEKQTIISVTSLEKSYKNFEVLKGVTFSVTKGSIFALLGSNGAGKTTTINILSTLAKANSGKATILGYDCFSQADQVRNYISLTGQFAAVDEGLTGKENLRMIGSLRHLKDVGKKADGLLKKFGLEEAANRRVLTYSGGMRRRLDIAMSLLGEPQVVFLDEPTTGLDPQNRLGMWEMVRTLAAEGTTVFLTTQYLEEAEQLADYIAVLHEGIIVAEGTPDKLKALLPQGMVEFTFHSMEDLKRAEKVFAAYRISSQEQSKSMIVFTDSSLDQFTDVLNLLKASGISVSDFKQQKPTLEDAFLTIIGEKKEDLTHEN